MHPLSRRIHPPLSAACFAQRVRQSALLRLIRTSLPLTLGCTAVAASKSFLNFDESGDAEQGQELAVSALAPILRRPSCGQGMRLQQTIQPTGRCPP